MRNERGDRWSFLRNVLAQGAAIQQDYAAGTLANYEAYSARLDAAARERADEWQGDDGTPITADWLRSLFRLRAGLGYILTDSLCVMNSSRGWQLMARLFDEEGDEVDPVCVAPLATRGQFRRLAAALSIPLADATAEAGRAT